MTYSSALAFSPEAYAISGYQVLGRLTAGEGFLRGYLEYGTFDTILCHTPTSAAFKIFEKQIETANPRKVPVQHLLPHQEQLLTECGVLYRPDPAIARFGWQRLNATAHSICGVTYTLADRIITEQIFDLLSAPVYPWDAVICISESGKKVIQNLLDLSHEYLRWRFEAKRPAQVELPVIPLGIDTRKFLTGENRTSVRKARRAALGLSDADFACLFVGRLTFFSKANPVPMFLALQQCSVDAGKALTLLLAGWFESEAEELAFQKASREFAPAVRVVFVKQPSMTDLPEIYAAADVFISLSDNIQETFGLTLVEAMASGLPVIASDWDGYREILQDGVQGFAVPTISVPKGSAEDLAAAYLQNSIGYNTFVGHASLMTAVSLPALVSAVKTLMGSVALRERMGQAGRERAQTTFDWKQIIPRYESLWAELTRKRKAAGPAYQAKCSPRCPDPSAVFSHYSTSALSEKTLLAVAPNAPSLGRLQAHFASGFGAEARVPALIMESWLQQARDRKAISISELAALTPQIDAETIFRSVAYLLKFNVLELKNS